MENRLKGLRKSLKNTTFTELQFTDEHRKQIKAKIYKRKEREEDLLFAVMQLLTEEKTGHELAKQLRGRGIQTFEDNEGFLYTLLHRLEHAGCLQTSWQETNAKYYQLSHKGRKRLKKAERKPELKREALKAIIEG